MMLMGWTITRWLRPDMMGQTVEANEEGRKEDERVSVRSRSSRRDRLSTRRQPARPVQGGRSANASQPRDRRPPPRLGRLASSRRAPSEGATQLQVLSFSADSDHSPCLTPSLAAAAAVAVRARPRRAASRSRSLRPRPTSAPASTLSASRSACTSSSTSRSTRTSVGAAADERAFMGKPMLGSLTLHRSALPQVQRRGDDARLHR